MKYKALLIGKNNSVIDDFFDQMGDVFETVTTSVRYIDIIRHLHYFQPDLCVYCIYNEQLDIYNQMINVKYQVNRHEIPFVLIGSREDCDEFEKTAINVSDLTLIKPLTAEMMRIKILKFMEQWNAEPEEEEEKELEKEEKEISESLEMVLPELNPTRRKLILIVDDSPIMLKTLKENLRDRYDVATAISGKIAMKFLERKTADLILLDYEMPEESGPVVLEKLRANDDTKDIPVIFLTGVTDSGKIREALVLKPKGYLLKPINHDKLLEAIENAVN